MCIALPARIIRVTGGTAFPMATVDVGGTIRECCLIYVPEATVGDYTIIHAGFALRILDEPEALAALTLFAEFGSLPAPPQVDGPSSSLRPAEDMDSSDRQ